MTTIRTSGSQLETGGPASGNSRRLPHSDRRRVLVDWNETDTEYPRDACFHELFEEQAGRSPDAIAAIFENIAVTYEQLNGRANAVAARLRDLRVGPEILVALYMERSIEMLVGLLGILKAGGAYVPLDPSYPLSRLQFILADSGARILLTHRTLENRLPADDLQVLFADGSPEASPGTTLNAASGVTAENLAYVIYTSGSTGRPKGALIPHRGLVNYLTWAVRAYEMDAGEGAPVHSSLSFDLTVTAILAPLLAGKCVHLLPEGEGVNSLSASLQKGVLFSLVKITPPHLELLSQQLPAVARVNTRVLVVGGENLLAESLRSWRAASPETVIVNEYGPTETVVGCCVYRVPSGDDLAGSVPIGRPIANTQLYVLDEFLEPVAIGEEGELFIGGDGVARGYLNQPELTAERFLTNPFREGPGARMYRTGDRVRYRADGNLEFLGRFDEQVKIRGYRIELGEIEAVLLDHPSVQQAVVVVRGETQASRSIVAYLVARNDKVVNVREIRELVRGTLPNYMVPSAFLLLDAVPLTPNGKIDRAALPAPDRSGRGLKAEYRVPTNARERLLASILENLFEIRPIGLDDDFFGLGGNSLIAARLSTEIEKKFGKRVSPAVLLRAPTVGSLLRVVDREPETGPSWTSLVPIQTEGSLPPLFCLHAGAGTILFYQELARTLGPDQPVYGLQAQGLYGGAPPQETVEEMAAHYIREIRTLQGKGPYFLAGFCFGAILAFEMAQQLRSAGETLGLLVALDGAAPHYDYSSDPAARPAPSPRSLRSRVVAQWRKFLSLSGRRRLAYVRHKIANQWANRTVAAQYRLGEWFRRRGRPLPGPIRRFYFLWKHEESERRYQPRVYPGDMVIFETAGLFRDRNLGWKNLVGGALEVCEIPGEHREHRDLLSGDFVRALSDELTRLIRSAASGRNAGKSATVR
ncbi:MAG: amino acid adenylation domain-containing protein [Acidobacteriota bacterium]